MDHEERKKTKQNKVGGNVTYQLTTMFMEAKI